MVRIEKSVFISYRRSAASWALAIYQNLTQHGYDVFFDYEGIASGDFGQVILENVQARAHFVVLLTPSALERCDVPDDWLRREIETALDTHRNVVPLMLEDFDFNTPSIAKHLTGTLERLKRYNGLRVPVDYFQEAMNRLREKYLNVPLAAVLHPASSSAKRVANEQQEAANAAPAVQTPALAVWELFLRGLGTTDDDERLRSYDEVVRRAPDQGFAYFNRGIARWVKGDLNAALADFGEAIRLEPDNTDAYLQRGRILWAKGELDAALTDFGEAIRLGPDNADAYLQRGQIRATRGDMDGALADFSEFIHLEPDNHIGYLRRGGARGGKADFSGALSDFNKAIHLKPDDAAAYFPRSVIRFKKRNWDGALQDLNDAIRLNPDVADPYYFRAKINTRNGDYSSAISDYKKYRELGGNLGVDPAELEKTIVELSRSPRMLRIAELLAPFLQRRW